MSTVKKRGFHVAEERMSILELIQQKPLEVVWMQPTGRRAVETV